MFFEDENSIPNFSQLAASRGQGEGGKGIEMKHQKLQGSTHTTICLNTLRFPLALPITSSDARVQRAASTSEFPSLLAKSWIVSPLQSRMEEVHLFALDKHSDHMRVGPLCGMKDSASAFVVRQIKINPTNSQEFLHRLAIMGGNSVHEGRLSQFQTAKISMSNQPFGEPQVPHYPYVRGPLLKFKNTFEFAVQNGLIQNLG
ncbi:hypothetical protein PDE_03983 [Penicillium oxalicum 114-2]|uniref:Uncharacterized protein n=1 Tax=Penicillium oxalicum (strain 114-2 / CGMCC 5302) TaxID=933388 RepID=S8B3F5_PENO1|nr:hypothetical protein PDE_03983 [Penicillium oxalicum 114-2]